MSSGENSGCRSSSESALERQLQIDLVRTLRVEAHAAAEVDQIAGRQRVSKTSSTDDSPDAGRHNHVVTFN